MFWLGFGVGVLVGVALVVAKVVMVLGEDDERS